MNLKNYGVTDDAVIPGKYQSPASVSSQIKHSPADFRATVNGGAAVVDPMKGGGKVVEALPLRTIDFKAAANSHLAAEYELAEKHEKSPNVRDLPVAFGCAFAAVLLLVAAFFSLKAAFDLGATSSESAGFAMLAVGCFVAVIALAETSLSRFFDE